jgi:hypothetical protein|tara:strand:+ start:350 stop:829 length:480 start_codon:yes stop_codon:yes gene_type:complete
MNLVKIIILVIIVGFANFKILYADNHDTTTENAETTSEIETETTSEIETEEDVPLNDPFAGNAASTETLIDDTANEPGSRSILYDYKLVGVISGSLQSYISLVDAGGEVITLTMFEELSDGLRLVDMNRKEVVFQKSDGKYLIINFKNQIVEKDDYAKL